MRISWGTKIALLYGGFVALILTLVGATFFRRSELVTDDYYAQETVFQKRLDAAAAAAALPRPVRLLQTADSIGLQFPAAFAGQPLTGTVRFYAPAHAAADRQRSLNVADGGTWQTARAGLTPVPYEVQVTWKAGGTEYYQAFPLNLQAP